MSRRNLIIRAVTSVVGDVAIGVAMASACLWVVQSASLGLFLAFMLWLLAAILSLAFSQYLFRPAVRWFLSDQKLDGAARTAASLADEGAQLGRHIVDAVMQQLTPALKAMTQRFYPS